jgi:hypothetical protein
MDGKRYTCDVIVSSKGVKVNWWRKEGHKLAIEDLAGVLQVAPQVVVIGTGRARIRFDESSKKSSSVSRGARDPTCCGKDRSGSTNI